MRFRLCCTCDDDEEKAKAVDNVKETTPSTVVPTVITHQPKQVQVDNVTEIPVEVTSVEEPKLVPAIVIVPPTETVKEQPIIPLPTRHEVEEPPELKIQEKLIIPLPTRLGVEEPPELKIQEKPTTVPGSEDKNEENKELYNHYKRLIDELKTQKASERAALAQLSKTPVAFRTPPSNNSNSTVTIESSIGDEKVTFIQVAPGQYQGTYLGSSFWVTASGKIFDESGAYSEYEKELLATIYSKAMEGYQKGMTTMQGLQQDRKGMDVQNNITPGTDININYVTNNGEKATLTFVTVAPGHFRSNFNGKDFSLINGEIVETTEALEDYEKEIILNNFQQGMLGMERGILGMQQGMLGMQQGMLGMQMGMSGLRMNNNSFGSTAFASGGSAFASTSIGGSAFASTSMGGSSGRINFSSSSRNVLGTGRETIRKTRLNSHANRTSILESSLTEPHQPMMIEDITESLKKSQHYDDIDVGILPEPVLQKTTFTPNAVIYEDPKEYEPQDENELPTAKRLDEFIISADENFNSENRYHFHVARPSRVTRPKLHPKDMFRLESPTRYSLFEAESLKMHNEYRKMHGVPPLVHNEFLCQVAKEWAEHLALKDAIYHRPKNEYGENLYWAKDLDICAKAAVRDWYDEIDLYDYSNPMFSKETGHFTQLVWKDTRELGTGVAQIGNKVWVCCNYHPPGNYDGKFNDEFVPRPIAGTPKRI